jgi:glycosyltransferase involved in cell wall biosynthesis
MSTRIRVLHLVSSFSVGGGEALVMGLAERGDRERFEIHVASLREAAVSAFKEDFAQLGLSVYQVGARRFYDPQAALAVARYVREHKIDLIHTHLVTADVVGRLVGRLTGVPVVSTLQNEPRSFQNMRRDRRWLERLTARHLTTQLVTVSRHVRDLFVAEWGIPAAQIDVIYNAVPVERYMHIAPGALRGEFGPGPVITNVGRLNPQKAQHLLIDAAKIVLRQAPDARFLIVGRGHLEEQLKTHARAAGVADQVIFTGLRRDIPEILAQSDIFVLSSLWEGLPLSAVEAMAAARPVVLTDVGGNRELVESGAQGLIVPPDDVPALATALIALLNDRAQAQAMGVAARARVRHDFSIDTIARQYEALYERVARPRPQAAAQPSVSQQ